MKRFFLLVALMVAVVPVSVSAHASPVAYAPASSETVTEAPQEVRIRFSERIEPGASRIVVKDEAGAELQEGNALVSTEDAHILFIPVASAPHGTFFVTWSVVSSDDGHFTKGGFTYFIGDTAGVGSEVVQQVEVVQLSAVPEAIAIAIELTGNSFLLGVLVLFAFVIRPGIRLMNNDARRAVSRVHIVLALLGITLALIGALAHVLLKSSELATLNSLAFKDALPLYLATVSGSATVIRAGAVMVFALLFFVRRRAIMLASHITVSEGLLVIVLAVFSYFRAIVSHATANPFHPEIGVAVNFLHLIGKDLSAGLLAGLLGLLLMRALREHLPALIGRGFRVLTALLALVGPTAMYIVWLHLKAPENFSASLWGERFLPLLASAVLAVALLSYHVIGNRLRPEFIRRFLRYTLASEFGAALLVVFFSSLMIITSPPLVGAHGTALSQMSNGMRVELAHAPYEDGTALITFSKAITGAPVILLDADAEGGTALHATERFVGGYEFPLSLLAGDSAHQVFISVAQESGYDARVTFVVSRAELEGSTDEGNRSFDAFGVVMLALALASIGYAVVLLRLASKEEWEGIERGSVLRTLAGIALTLLVASQIDGALALMFGNRYKQECVADGNAWHLMLPSRDGRPVAQIPQEGCMALGGSYHLPDVREYRYLKAPSPSHVDFSAGDTPVANVPTTFTFSMKHEDGSPARLSVEHERFVHVIVVSSDMKEFFHVHPDDDAPLTSSTVRDASFTMPFTFPKAGEYLVGIDYADGLSSRSEQFRVTVTGLPHLDSKPEIFPLRGTYGGYDITLTAGFPTAGQPANLMWRVQKDGKDVTDLEPYLAAAMHIALVKDDFSEFVHAHGEVHLPGTPIPKASATTVHNHTPPPPRFGPIVEAHTVFPSAGDYTVFAQFKRAGEVITAPFSIRVE